MLGVSFCTVVSRKLEQARGDDTSVSSTSRSTPPMDSNVVVLTANIDGVTFSSSSHSSLHRKLLFSILKKSQKKKGFAPVFLRQKDEKFKNIVLTTTTGRRVRYHSCLLLLVRQAGYIVNLSEFYSYRLIGKLTAFLQLQEFRFHRLTQVASSPSAARLSSRRSRVK